MTRGVAWSSFVYGNLLRLCAAELRAEFGAEVALVFEDDLREACEQRGLRGFAAVWWCALLELIPLGLSSAFDAPRVVVPLISLISSALCMGGELALARAHAPAIDATVSLSEAVWAVVVWPSLTACAVSFVAVRTGTRLAPLRLTDGEPVER